MDKRIAKNNLLSFTFNTALSLLSFIIIVRTLSAEKMGVWVLISSFYTVGSMIDLGTNNAVVRYINQIDHNEKYDFFFTFLLVLFGVGCVTMTVTFYLSLTMVSSSEYILTYHLIDQGGVVILIALSALANYLKLFQNYVRLTLEALNHFITTNRINNISVAIQLCTTFLWAFAIEDDFKLIFVPVIFIIPVLVSLVLLVSYLKTEVFSGIPFRTFFSFRIFRECIAFSSTLQLSSFLSTMIDPVTKYFISKYLGLSFTTYYETAKKISDVIFGMGISIQRQLTTQASQSIKNGTLIEFMHKGYLKYAVTISSFNLIAMFVFILVSSPLMYFMFNSYDSVKFYILLAVVTIWQNNSSGFYGVLIITGSWLDLIIYQVISLVALMLVLTIGFSIYQGASTLVLLGLISIFNFLFLYYLLNRKIILIPMEVISQAIRFKNQILISIYLLGLYVFLNTEYLYKLQILISCTGFIAVSIFLRKDIIFSFKELYFLNPFNKSNV